MLLDYRKIQDLTRTELRKLLDSIGNTPLLPIYLLMHGVQRKVWLKLESANPTGSMKDRTGLALIQHLEKQGVLHEQSTIIESTSGNLGVALAFQCRARGYRFIAVVDPKTTQENLDKMVSLGAQLEKVDQPDVNGGYLLSRLARVQELCARHSTYVWTNQYSCVANPGIHYLCTGPEIYQQMQENVDAVFVPVSTGGTLAGIGRFFREVSPTTHIVGVDAHGSVVFGMPPGQRKLTGIGSSRRSDFLSEPLYDTHMLVKDEEAFAFCRTLFSATGIKLGGSSGATIAACSRYLATHQDVKNVVCVCADKGENYNSSIYNERWLHQQSITLSQEHLGILKEIRLA